MITLRDVARESGFSVTTISVVLSEARQARQFPEATRKHIRKVAERLGYRPDLFARYLRSRRSHTVGVMVSDIMDPYCNQVLRGIETALYKFSYLAVLVDIQNRKARFRRYVEMLLERRVDGLITVANSLTLETDLLDAFLQNQVPAVIIGRETAGRLMHSVVANNEAGARAAMEHLHTLGHRQIAIVRGPKQVLDSKLRWQGILKFGRAVGLEIDPALTVEIQGPTSSYEAGFEAVRELLTRGKPFTAVMAFDDLTAFGVIRALKQHGRKVPETCSVVGFDDIAAAAFYNPSLTTICQSIDLLGSTSVDILEQAIRASLGKKAFKPVHKVIQPSLVIRESTSAPAY
jgi:LacI family transcriptional regulator